MARQRLPYTTDLTDEEWQILKPLLPPAKSGGRPRRYPMREVLKGIQYVLRTGCAWRLMPHDLPPWQRPIRPSAPGATMAPGAGFTINGATRSGLAWGVIRNPRPPSSTPKRSTPPQKGGPRRRWRQDTQRSQAPSPR
jgi:transposase